MVQLLHLYITTRKTIALTIQMFVGKVISLLFNMLSVFEVCHSFLSKELESFNFMATVTIHSDFGAQENKICHYLYFFPFYLPWSDGTVCHDLSSLNAEFQASFYTLLFHLIKRQSFSSSSLSAIRVVSSEYLRFLLFLPTILIPACDSYGLAFRMIYSRYELSKQGDNMRPCCTPLPILNQSVVSCQVLAVASWLTYKFLRRQEIYYFITFFYHSRVCYWDIWS